MKIFVGCSSRDIGNERYNYVADKIGEWIASEGHELVFGGCGEGLMGRVYNKVKGRCKIHATQAKVYQDELDDIDECEKYVIDTINQRKDFYSQIADVLVYLPGGIGTMDEIVTGIETRRCGEHTKTLIIINESNFFEPLFQMLEKIFKEGLASESVKECYFVADNVEQAIEKLTEICR